MSSPECSHTSLQFFFNLLRWYFVWWYVACSIPPIKSISVQSADGSPTTVLEYKEWKSIGCLRLVLCTLIVFAV
jgi:hypothetical protein